MSRDVEEETQRKVDPRTTSPSATQWFLVDTQTGTALSLNREMVFVGRLKCDVVLNSASIDNRHAVMCFNPKDGCVYLRDLNTSHGTFVNDTKLPAPSYIKINRNDKIRFGLSSQTFIVSNGPNIPKESSSVQMSISSEAKNHEACDGTILSTACQLNSEHKEDACNLAPKQGESCASSQQRIMNKVNQSSSLIQQPTPEQHPSCNKATTTVPTCENGSRKENGVIGSTAPAIDPLPKSSIFSPHVDVTDAIVPEFESTPKPHPAAFTISFDDDANCEKKKRFTIGDSIRKFAPKKTFERQRRSSKPPSTHSNQSPTEVHEPRSLPIMSGTVPHPPTQLSDSAVFLIQRMFASEQTSSKAAVEEDLKSEAGTYTLEADGRNVDLERARKMIDNVFGVEGYVESNAACFSGSVPCSPHSSRSNSCRKARSTLPKDIQRPQISLQNETRSRTFTRSKPRRGSLQEQLLHHSPDDDDETSFERSRSLRSKVNGCPRKPIPNPKIEKERRDSFSSSKSGMSSKTIEVKTAAVINHVRRDSGSASTRSPRPQRRQMDFVRPDHLAESLSSGSGSGGHAADCAASAPTGLKLNRAFALRRARLGIDTPGVPLNLTDEKQKKNQDNKNRNNYHGDSSLSRNDGGRFSLRLSKSAGKPPLPNSHPASPAKRPQDTRKQVQLSSSRTLRAGSESNQNVCLSPSSSSSSIPNQFVQRSSSFGPQSSARSSHRKGETSDRTVRAMTPMQMSRRMFSVRPHQQQQYSDSVRNKQQANVAPIKRSPEAAAPSHMTSSLNEQISDQHSLLSHQPVIQRRTLSSLDNLVVSAILQLSGKLRFGMREWLEQEKVKHVPGSETRLMIDEILPQVSSITPAMGESASSSENLSKDLSTILKNLKKVEQSLEVISLLAALEPANMSNRVSLSVAKDAKANNS